MRRFKARPPLSAFFLHSDRINLSANRAVAPTSRTPCPLRPFSRLRAALPVLPNGRPRPIAPVPGNVPSQSILKRSRPELSNSWCPSWRARRGPRWEAAAWARSEAKRSNSQATTCRRWRGSAAARQGDFVLLGTIPPSSMSTSCAATTASRAPRARHGRHGD